MTDNDADIIAKAAMMHAIEKEFGHLTQNVGVMLSANIHRKAFP